MQALTMADGKDRQRLLARFDDELHAPFGGGSNTDELINLEFSRAPITQ